MPSTTTIIALVVVGIVLILVVFTFILKPSPKSTSNSIGKTTAVTGNTLLSTTTIPGTTKYNAVNVEYIYSGPKNFNSTTPCYYSTYAYVFGQSGNVNGTKIFPITLQPQSNNCNLTITKVLIDTVGFTIVNTTPVLPFKLPPHSSADLQINIKAPPTNFTGPLTLQIYDK